ncbi:MAG: 1-deoxy-D-xylulose-5-phosphate reductoisomerase, partial [Hymenobacteraceae bacterium]|nr:1-deoxy-D-xylulose-5-phosphate reductoisomerase [Hymenobacteraceae bacterium]MDX5394645.1 1-deoxy-D-xylulose-5-phosphate reductoisomerase [Hymenobacteraceae bacterium]MDX5510676.1 1-deoxy-D-xylulose-5-phosphate reductoisomerase [Hymenobacteraceae bacterium]
MKLPIQYALAYPNRLKSDFKRFNFLDYPQLTFEQPDLETFRNLALAFEAMKKGGNMPCILNAANEVAVQAFLNDEVGFLEMSDIIENTMAKVAYIANPALDDYIQTDAEARRLSLELVGSAK